MGIRGVLKRVSIIAIAASLVGAQALACMSQSNEQALDVVGLKSSLMVAALACGQRDQYNQFMDRFQPHVLAAQERIDGYFRARYGSRFHVREDRYITNLANVQSSAGIRQGVDFCGHASAVFGEVLALTNTAALDDFARQQPAAQPVVIVACGVEESASFRRVERFAETP